MSKQFLGHVIKSDRKALKMSQRELQELVNNSAIQQSTRLSPEEKETLLASGGYYIQFKGRHVFSPIASKLISNIERGMARYANDRDLMIIAKILHQDPEKYFNLEINPMKLIEEPQTNDEDKNWFDRSIEFSPEFRQAGVSILSFFSEVVRSEYSDQDVRVGILQQGDKVTLRVETPDGTVLKEIEKTLEKYGLVVMGSAPVESLSDNRELIRDLKTKLEVTSLELRLRQESHLEHRKQYENRIVSLEEQVKQLHGMIGSNLAHYDRLTEIIRAIVSNDKITKSLEKALNTIDKLAKSEFTEESARRLETSIIEIEKESPGLIIRLITTLETVPSSILANLVSPWVQTLFSSLPH